MKHFDWQPEKSSLLTPREEVSSLLGSLFLLLAMTAVGFAEAPAPLPETTPWNITELYNAPSMEWLRRSGASHSLTYRGEPYEGKPTRVFAYYASPTTLGMETDEKKFPGIVLVHGGGGKAFSRWVEIWARRGYAAIAMDLSGRGKDGERLADGGPEQTGQVKFGNVNGPVKDQWSYHAVANVILAHSLLLGFEEVDQQRTALTGISWGGYLTCIVAGLDGRFQVAMPVYGCGFLHENSFWVRGRFSHMPPEQVAKWVSLWDPSRYLGAATMAVVFINGTNDFAYPMDSYAKTCRLVRGEKNYRIQLQMPHGHIFAVPEFFLFIDQYLKGGTPLPVVSRPEVKDGQVIAKVKSPVELVSARLHFTTGPHTQNKTRTWVTKPLVIEGNTIHGEAAPRDATVWYVDVTDKRKALVSSEVMVPEHTSQKHE